MTDYHDANVGANDYRRRYLVLDHDPDGRRVLSESMLRIPREGLGVAVVDAGESTLWTPQPDHAIRVVWVAYFTKALDPAPAAVDVVLRMGAADRFLVPMSFPFAFAHGTAWQGEADEPLLVDLSAGGNAVYVNVELEEFVP